MSGNSLKSYLMIYIVMFPIIMCTYRKVQSQGFVILELSSWTLALKRLTLMGLVMDHHEGEVGSNTHLKVKDSPKQVRETPHIHQKH
jgi:hypothetical protein